MIDVDRFKPLNDRHGHQVGDASLARVGQVIHANVRRAGDMAARYGGEEFAVVLPGTAAADALEIAEHIRRAVAAATGWKCGSDHLPPTPDTLGDTAMNDQALVLTEIHPDGCAVLTLNRPQAMNALNQALMRALTDAVDALAANPAVRVLVLTGAGRAFCAGLDLKELGAGTAGIGGGLPAEHSLGSGTAPGPARADPVAAIGRFAGPVIGAVNGAAVTGGFELALACDVLLASSHARFADTHARIGVAPGWGLSQKLSRAIGVYRARELSFTGNWIGAEQAAAWGFVNRVVAPDMLLPTALALAADMLGTLPAMLLRYKAVINDGWALPAGEALVLEQHRARDFNRQVAAGDVEQRREAVRQRNRGGA